MQNKGSKVKLKEIVFMGITPDSNTFKLNPTENASSKASNQTENKTCEM